MSLKQFLTLFLILGVLSACQSDASKREDADTSKRAGFHYRLGIDALHKGLLPKAFNELLLADKILPNNPETLDALAYSWRVRGNKKEAEKYYKRAIREGGGSATYNNYASLLIEKGEYKKAEKNLRLALEDPRYRNQAIAFTNLGDALVGQEDLEGSIKAYRKAHMLSPNWDEPQLREAQAYVKFKRPNYAQALYETILRNDTSNQKALEGLIILLKGRHENASLKKYIQTFIEHEEDPLKKAWAKDELEQLG
jgi:Tfp pilus assembly protein PilF